MSSRPSGDPSAVAALTTLVACFAGGVFAVSAGSASHALVTRPFVFATFAGVVVLLQLMQVEIYGRGTISVAGIGALACGFTLGVGAAIVVQAIPTVIFALRARARFNRALFTGMTWALAAAAGAETYALVAARGSHTGQRFAGAAVGGVVFWAVNIGLLTLAMSLAEHRSFRAIWQERFAWLTPHYLAFGPLALASTLAYERVGTTGLIAFVLPPALLIVSIRQYLHRTRSAVEELRDRNADLKDLFGFAGGLAARTHDRDALIAYAEEALSRLTGGRVHIATGAEAGGLPLVTSGAVVGGIAVEPTPEFDASRWERLGETLAPQLATAIESATLVDEVRRVHLATIAALSRSMEAKDGYTGGHTERVAEFAVALARRLDYSGADVDAIEVGALLHDIGKIGVPERILHKPGPLDDEEWKVMKEHPVISERILAEADLPEIVLQIARHSHERLDGRGYPDGLAGDEIPLAARIVLVADALDALTSDRPYRRGRHVAAAVEALRAESGTQFCPRVIAALEQLYREEPHLLGGSTLRAVDIA